MSKKKLATVRHLKRYGGCRLYDPETGTYLGADDLRRLVLAGVRISVREVANGQDVTDEVTRQDLH